MKKVLWYSLGIVTTIGVVMGVAFYLLGPVLSKFYTSDAIVIEYALNRMKFVCLLYALCGIMDVLVGFIRGVGYSVIPMVVSLLGVCAFRILWIFTVFAKERTLDSLYISYPISWTITIIVLAICIFVFYPNIKKKMQED